METIANYGHICCDVNLKKISNLLERARPLSIDMDISTHICMSYLNIRIQLHLDMPVIINMNVMAIPIYDWHTSDVIFNNVINLSCLI